MEQAFWLERWQKNEIGFHRSSTHPMLVRHWPMLPVLMSTPVLVPLCGKSRDMNWLHDRGHPVTGIELSRDALAQFVAENGLELEASDSGFTGHGWQLLAGDFFEQQLPEAMPAFYDRAALIALPPDMRPAYVRHLRSLLAPGAAGLLITLEYDPSEMNGPPFSVTADEVRSLFEGAKTVVEIERVDGLILEPSFRQRGLTSLWEVAWHVRL